MRNLFVILAVVLQLAACAGVGVVATSDPATKLSDASDLLTRQGRPLLAETLIRETIVICKNNGNAQYLGHAYRQYAEFLESPQVASEPYYQQRAFQEPGITFDNRLTKAAQYYSMAIAQYQIAEGPQLAASRFDQLANVYYNMALSYERLRDSEQACKYYDRAHDSYEQNVRNNPGAKPRGNIETLSAAKQRLRCT